MTITENECTLTDDHIYNNFGFKTTIQAVKLDKAISEVVVQNEYLNIDKPNTINASKNGFSLKNSALRNWEKLHMYMGIIPYKSNYRIRYLEYSSLRRQEEGLHNVTSSIDIYINSIPIRITISPIITTIPHLYKGTNKKCGNKTQFKMK